MKRLPILPSTEGPKETAGACGTSKISVARPSSEPSVMVESDFGGNVALVTLGCAKNLVDSEVMLGVLQQRGFRAVNDPQHAELIVVNTCAFLQSAVEEGIDRILELSELKKTGRCRKLIVAGCMVERYRDELVKTLPEVDRFISTDELLTVADDESTSAQALDSARRPYFLYDESMPRVISTGGHTGFLKVAEGCNRPCAFCIIPKIRGEFRSRPLDSVVREARHLLASGIRELNLVAQDLTSYGADLPGNRGVKGELPSLLRALSALSSEFESFWVRPLYAYPIGVTEELMRLLADSPGLCPYIDLPLQHISHNVLKAMRRPLGEKGTRALIAKMREVAPNVAIRTTFIVGFPGETEEDVDALQQFVAEGHFTHVGVFTYSQESEADAYHYDNQVPDEVKEARRARVMEAQQEVVARRNEALIGTRVRVLIDGFHEETDLLLTGRTAWQAPETDGSVLLNDLDDSLRSADGEDDMSPLIGRFAEVLITESAGYDLVGTILSVEPEQHRTEAIRPAPTQLVDLPSC